VYDITDFIEQHPGGEVILRACGGSIDAYWKLFSIHQKPEVYDILKDMYIGQIDERDLNSSGQINWEVLGDKAKDYVVDDLFQHDPKRDPSLIYQTEKPCNAETPGNLLTDFLTPLRLFFVRNHFWVPRDGEAPGSLTIGLSDGEEMTYSLDDLKSKFKEHTITVTLQCSGNRRSHMSKSALGKTSGLQWDIGAIGTAEFSGVRLRDVLKDAGYCVEGDCPAPKQCATDDCDKHVEFTSPSDTYAVSIPLQTAINPQADVLLAWDMNGEPINRDHGGPIRAVVPGTTAARSVKWLGKVSIGCDESASQWQQRDYKCFGPNVKQTQLKGEDWEEAQAIQETPVQSAITNILKANGNNKTTVQGFAYSGGGRSIVRVDVSADGGKTWKQADLHKDQAKGSRRWAWTMWSIQWPKDEIKPGQETEFVVKAVDDSYNTQPETFEGTWNFRGLCANAWYRITVPAEAL
jgi:sulfite oxidase